MQYVRTQEHRSVFVRTVSSCSSSLPTSYVHSARWFCWEQSHELFKPKAGPSLDQRSTTLDPLQSSPAV